MATKLSIRVYSSAIRTHIHDHHQLFFPLVGGATCVISQETYRVGPGQCILYPAGIEHYCIPDDHSKYLVTDLDELPVKLQNLENPLISVPPPLQAFFYFAEKQLDYRVNPSLEKSMGELVEELLRELDFQPRVDPRVARVMAFFEKDLSFTASLDELSSLAGLSLSQFKALFKKETGKTPGGFLRDLRMEKAKALLVNTDYPIGIVAEMVGYFDASSFSHRFSSHFGFPPRNLRRE
jgi:AraC-like DNA-binding protein